jgi:hypothetical protein
MTYSTYLGGHTWDEGHALSVDGNNYVYVTGRTDSSTFPVTTGASDTTFGAFRDAFVTKFMGSQMDFVATALEVNQGIQDLENNMPLVANRATWARGYIQQVNPDYPSGEASVDARLYGYRNGTQIGSAEIPLNSVSAQSGGGDRLKLGHSFLFHVPKSWRTGTVTFTLEVNLSGYGQIEEIDKTNNVINETLTFNSVAEPCLIMVPIHLHGDVGDITYHTTDPGFERVLGGFWRYHPIPDIVNLWKQPTLYPAGHSLGAQWDLSNGADRSSMLQRIRMQNWFSDDPEAGCHYVGMVSPDADTTKGTGDVLGLARTGGKESWVKMEDSTPDKAPAWYQEGAQTLGHELGHNKGLKHVLCKGDEADPDSAYPWPNPTCALADNDPTGYYGLTVYHGIWGIDQTVISNDREAASANQGFPVMGYKHYQWVSPWEYCKLLDTAYGVTCNLWNWSGLQELERDAFQNPSALLSAEELDRFETAANFIVLGGFIDTNTNSAEIQEVYTLDALPASMREQAISNLAAQRAFGVNASYALIQVDQGGGVLATQALTLVSDDEDDGLYAFLEALPAASGVKGVQVRGDSTILDARVASDNPPTVQVVSPNGGETLSAGFAISWTAADLDGDSLSFDVFYSPDNGVTWTLLAMGITNTSWQLPSLDAIPGSDQGRIRVVTNDGFNTSMDTCDGTVSVPNSIPQALIIRPSDGLTITDQDLLIFEGMSLDNEDGPNAGTVSWISSIDGFLSAERDFAFSGLSEGEHQVTLTVDDSQGAVGSDSVSIIVVKGASAVYLPFLSR